VKYPGLSDFAGLFLFPGLAAILPWRFCFRVFHRLAGMDFLYRAEMEAALAGVVCIAPPEDKAAWAKAGGWYGWWIMPTFTCRAFAPMPGCIAM